MNYELLSVLFYKDNSGYEAEYEKRYANLCATHLPVDIHGHQAFYLHLPELRQLIETIYRINQSIETLWGQLPQKAQSRCFTRAMFSEVELSNEMEGVHSSRKDLQKAFDSLNSSKKAQYKGLIRSYSWLYEKREIPLSSSKDLREIYDHTFLPDIKDADAPDGQLFRKEPVFVHSASDQIIHQGITPEAKLISFVDACLQHLIQSDFSLAEIAAFHYLFGYAHPFYDGNGRTSRFLSSLFLSINLNQLIGLNLSATILSERSSYYKAFDVCNDKKNKGDITHFVLYFLRVILRSAENIKKTLTETTQQFAHYTELLNQQEAQLTSLQNRILYLLIQVSLFSDNGIGIGGIGRHVKKSYYPCHNALTSLIEQGFPITSEKQGNQLLYRLDLTAFESMGNLQ